MIRGPAAWYNTVTTAVRGYAGQVFCPSAGWGSAAGVAVRCDRAGNGFA